MTNDARITNEIISSTGMKNVAFYKNLFDQKRGVKFKEGTSKLLHLDHSFVWCSKLGSSESRSQLLRMFWNVVLQKDRGDQLDWSFEKWRSVSKNRREEEHPTHNKTKEA